jgi:hypothetical protein
MPCPAAAASRSLQTTKTRPRASNKAWPLTGLQGQSTQCQPPQVAQCCQAGQLRQVRVAATTGWYHKLVLCGVYAAQPNASLPASRVVAQHTLQETTHTARISTAWATHRPPRTVHAAQAASSCSMLPDLPSRLSQQGRSPTPAAPGHAGNRGTCLNPSHSIQQWLVTSQVGVVCDGRHIVSYISHRNAEQSMPQIFGQASRVAAKLQLHQAMQATEAPV